MIALANGLLIAFLALLALPVTVLMLEVLFAFVPRRPAGMPDTGRPRIAVLVPAHNESAGIAGALDSVRAQLLECDRIIVIADNCSDDTAKVAAACGAEVVERNEPSMRGKGHALSRGVLHLEQGNPQDHPEVVVVIDADCSVADGALDRISRLTALTGRPVQCLYMMEAPDSAGPTGAIAEFAWIMKNKVRPLGAHNAGFPCQLMGTGMSLPWLAMRSLQLANGQIVEDLKMGLDLARAGLPALFSPEALVVSRFAGSAEGARTQRLRWEHGHLSLILSEAAVLFFEGIAKRRASLIMLALDLSVPPLALLALLIVAAVVLGVLNAILGVSHAALYGAGVLAAVFGLAISLPWWRFARHIVPISSLPHLITYFVGKLPVYFEFLVRRQKSWMRTKRDGD
jgi:cellulose synthase/poly-beta-1,6-N-acetylglucosamine synthase-like glycosyltransferase